MTFVIKCLRRDGIILTAEELVSAQLYTGILVVEDLQKGKKDGRFFRVRLLESLALHEAPRDVIPPLFDGQIWTFDKVLKLHGYQFHADVASGIRRYRQEWALRKIAKN